MEKLVPRTSFFHKEGLMREENYIIVHPRLGAYFTALSGRTGAKRLSVLELSPDNTEEKEEISS